MSALQQQIATRDILLHKLEESVTRLAEDLTPVKNYVISKMGEEVVDGCSQALVSSERLFENHHEGAESTAKDGILANGEQEEDLIRNRCIETMMSMTEILQSDEDSTSAVRGWYEKIYDSSSETSFILRVIEKCRQVRIKIDYGSDSIMELIKQFVDRNGEKVRGNDFQAYADLNRNEIYAAGKCCRRIINTGDDFRPIVTFTKCLAQVALCFVFQNQGFPYSRDDKFNEELYMIIVRDIIDKNNSMYGTLTYFLRMKASFAREVELISVIPGMLVELGLNSYSYQPHTYLPSLFLYYMYHVHPKMKKCAMLYN